MYAGLDLGTTNVKAVVLDGQGRVVAEGSHPVERSASPGGAVEHDVEQIWQAVLAALRLAIAASDGAAVRALGVSSQGGVVQMLDEADRPVGRAISWLDQRGAPYDARLVAELGEDGLAAHTGCNSSAMVPGQLLRLAEEAPEQFAAPQLGFVGDVIVGRLCGRRAHDATSLSIALLYNPALGTADPEMLRRLRIDGKRLPDLLPATSPAGPLSGEAVRATGLAPGIPVSPAVHDQYAAAIGAGAVEEGDVNFGAGTAWVLLANAVGPARPVTPRTFVCPHPVAGLTGHLLSMSNGGSAVDWALRLTGCERLAPEELDNRLEQVPPGADGLQAWPLPLSTDTEGGPLARGGRIDGFRLGHTSDHLLRAMVEGLACELARHLDMLAAGGFPVRRLLMSGPAAASRVTPQIIADVTGRDVAALDYGEMSGRGAALIARAMVEDPEGLGPLAGRLALPGRPAAPGRAAGVYTRLRERYMGPFAATGWA